MTEERLEEIKEIDFTRSKPCRCVDYAKQRINNIRKLTDCKNVKHELELLMDNLHDIEYQFDLHVTEEFHKEKMIAKNIEIATLKESLRESTHERVHLITELEKAEEHLRYLAPNELKDDLYIYKWKKYLEG